MNNRLLVFSILSVALLSACVARGQTPSGSEESESSSGSSQADETYQKVFTFKGFDFTAATNFGLEGKREVLLNFLNSNEAGFFTSIETENVYAQASGNPEQTLSIGSGSYGGTFKLNCKYDITSIEFKIQGYYKYNSYADTYSVDANSSITVEGTTYSIGSTDTSKVPDEHNESLNFSNPKKSITFENDGDHMRVFLNELTINYKM